MLDREETVRPDPRHADGLGEREGGLEGRQADLTFFEISSERKPIFNGTKSARATFVSVWKLL